MFKIKKSLGQHFLKDEIIIQKIIAALKEDECTNLLEVGPGGGALTKHLVQLPGIHFKAVELDDEKTAYLHQGLEKVCKTSGIPYIINRLGSMMSIHFSDHAVTDFATAASAAPRAKWK